MKQTQQFPSPLVEQELVKMENEWARAWQEPDLASLETLLADDFTLVSSRSKGEIINKRQYIDTTLKLVHGEGYSFEKMSVRLYGETAVIHAIFQQNASFAGRDWQTLQLEIAKPEAARSSWCPSPSASQSSGSTVQSASRASRCATRSHRSSTP